MMQLCSGGLCGEVMPLSAAFLDGGYVEVIYPQHRELRTWPFWEVLECVRAEPAAMPYDERRMSCRTCRRRSPGRLAVGSDRRAATPVTVAPKVLASCTA